MSINRIGTPYYNGAEPGLASVKPSSSESTITSFTQEFANWETRIKAAIEKERENDRNGSIQMSEKQWRKLMSKVDHALDAVKEKREAQKQEEERVERQNILEKDTALVSPEAHAQPFQPMKSPLTQSSGYVSFLLKAGEEER